MSGSASQNNKIIKDIDFQGVTLDLAERELEKIVRQNKRENNYMSEQIYIYGLSGGRERLPSAEFLNIMQDSKANKRRFCQVYLSKKTFLLDGVARISLVNDQEAGDFSKEYSNSFNFLMREDRMRERVRRIIYESIAQYLVFDPTKMGSIRLRLSNVPLPEADLERQFTSAAVDFFQSSEMVADKSDGIKAFVGLIIEAFAGERSVLLVDEPESFLHSSLSFMLGRELGRSTEKSDKTVFASTHSASFLKGVILSGANMNIIRMNYSNGVSDIRALNHRDVVELMRDPLMRSASAMEGLFSEFVVVCEGDTDRAFYEEINERLSVESDARYLSSCLFINAQNKQTIMNIIGPLRKMGIPAACIVDIDVIKEGGTVWNKYLEGIGIPLIQYGAMRDMRRELFDSFEKTGRNWKREGGLDLLPREHQEMGRQLFSILAEYGMFVVPGGEIESWLPHLDATGHGPEWLVDVFGKMGANPDSRDYLRPSDGDVWDFLGVLQGWMKKVDRKGMLSP